MKTIRLLWLVIKNSGANKVITGFLAVFLLCALLVMFFEPGINNYGDACWFLFAVSTTVGLGDFTAITLCGRVATVVCAVCAIIATAVITSVILDFFNEKRQLHLQESVTEFLDKLERLPELDKDELTQISERVKKLRTR